MRFSTSLLVSVAGLPALVAALNIDVAARQATQVPPPPAAPAPSSAATSAASTPAAPPPGASSPVSGASTVPSGSLTGPPPPPTVSFSILTTNPTAVPLSSIVSGASLMPTIPLASTAVVGATPTYLPGAPPLPNIATLSPANYPALDKPPPTDSPEVQQWIQDVANSGVVIPDLQPTVAGGCPANPQFAADTSRCWWTCGGCTGPADITTCPDKLTWGLTYDDGPANYTSNLLNYLDQVNLKSTFFVVGSRVISYPATLQDQYMNQHQIAVHTWSHPPLTTLTNEEIIAELGWSKKVIKDVLGVTPNIMRPPYGDIDNRVRAISIAMGLTPVIWTRISPLATFDTGDFNINGGLTSVSQVLQNWEYILGNVSVIPSGFIVLEHDLFQQTVEVATGYILPDALAHQPPFSIKPVIQCLNKPLSDAYIETNDNSSNPPAISGSAVTLTSVAPGSTSAADNGNGDSSGGGGSSSSASMPNLDLNLALAFTTVAGLIAGVAALY